MKPFPNFTLGTTLSALLSLAGASAHTATLGGPLALEDEGALFVGGKTITSNYPGASLVTGRSGLMHSPTLCH